MIGIFTEVFGMDRAGSGGFCQGAHSSYVPWSAWPDRCVLETDSPTRLHLLASRFVIYRVCLTTFDVLIMIEKSVINTRGEIVTVVASYRFITYIRSPLDRAKKTFLWPVMGEKWCWLLLQLSNIPPFSLAAIIQHNDTILIKIHRFKAIELIGCDLFVSSKNALLSCGMDGRSDSEVDEHIQ